MNVDSVSRDGRGWYVLDMTLANGKVVTLSHPRWRTVVKRARELRELDGGAA